MNEPRTQAVPCVPAPVTYIVAAYNAEKTLGRALDSLARQDRGDWAAVIVDDGSTDRTADIARERAGADARLRVLSQSNAGAAAARNAGASLACSDFVAILDADDELAPVHLSKMLDLVQARPGYDIYSSDGYFIRPDSSRVPVFGYSDETSVTLEQLMAESLILGGGTLIRTEAFRALGGFRPGVYIEDYDLWLRALSAGYQHIATPERLYLYRVGAAGQKSSDRIASVNSAIGALADLIASGKLSGEGTAAAERAIASYESDLALETQAVRLRQTVERRFGRRMTPVVMSAIHSVSWITRPWRRWLSRRH